MKQTVLAERRLARARKTEPGRFNRAMPGATKVSLNALAMVRGFVQGLPIDKLIDLYMPPQDDRERADRWAGRAAMEHTRAALVAAARRRKMDKEERLLAELTFSDAVRRQAPTLPDQAKAALPSPAAEIPTFDQWLDSMGGADALGFSLGELMEQYKANFDLTAVEAVASFVNEPDKEAPNPYRTVLLAINALALHVLEEPAPGHAIGGWMGEGIARRLRPLGLVTLRELHAYMNANGHDWWKNVERLGLVSAERISAWFRQHRIALQLDLRALVLFSPGSQEARLIRTQSAPCATEIVPIERFLLPKEVKLSGVYGDNRGRNGQSIAAENDLQAILAWLEARTGNSENTRKSYRKEAERLLYWCIFESGKAMSDMKQEDCAAFLLFLKGMGPSNTKWCGKIQERSSPDWRPFNSALSDRSIKHAQIILTSMFRWLWEAGYLANNPFALNAKVKIRSSTEKIQVKKALSKALVNEVEAMMRDRLAQGDEKAAKRWRLLRAVYYLGIDCGLRREEISLVRRDQVEYRPANDAWVMEFMGKGSKMRKVVLTRRLVTALREHAQDRGLSFANPGDWVADRQWPLLAPPGREFVPSPTKNLPAHQGYGRDGIYDLIIEIANATAAWVAKSKPELQEAAMRMRTHGLRHTFGKRAVERGMKITDLQNMMGHASPATTSIYTETEEEELIAAGKLMDG